MDPKFKEYVDKYCLKHKVDVETALSHKVVKEVKNSTKRSGQNVKFFDRCFIRNDRYDFNNYSSRRLKNHNKNYNKMYNKNGYF